MCVATAAAHRRRSGGACAAASFTLQTLQRTLASERSNEEVRSDLRYVR